MKQINFKIQIGCAFTFGTRSNRHLVDKSDMCVQTLVMKRVHDSYSKPPSGQIRQRTLSNSKKQNNSIRTEFF